jgi:hypothetical protein
MTVKILRNRGHDTNDRRLLNTHFVSQYSMIAYYAPCFRHYAREHNRWTNYSREQCFIHCISPQKLKRGKTSFTLKSSKNLRLSSHWYETGMWSWECQEMDTSIWEECAKSIFKVNGYKYCFSRLLALVYQTTWHHITFLSPTVNAS